MALVSPLDALGTALFSAHMAQHLVLMIPASLLLVLGAPTLPTLHALPRGTMRAPVVWLLNAVVVCAWHMPALYDAALANEAVHALEHASFLGVSALLWAVVFPRRPHRPGQGSGILLMVGTGMQGGLLAAMLVFAERAWYDSYATLPILWGFTPLEDQQLAGAIMWVPSGIAYLLAATALFLIWILGPPRARTVSASWGRRMRAGHQRRPTLRSAGHQQGACPARRLTPGTDRPARLPAERRAARASSAT